MLNWKSHSKAFERFESVTWQVPAKWLGTALVASSLAACGGGSDSDGSGPWIGSDDGSSRSMSVQELPPAVLDSEETAVLLSPGSLFFQTVGMTQGVLASFDPLAGYDQVEEDTLCDNGGRIKLVGIDLANVESPYNGDLFNAVTTDDQECLNGNDGPGGEPGLYVYTDGLRTIGRPRSGVGAVGDADVFVAYEQSGSSAEDPFTVLMSEGDDLLFGWARLWTGHVRLERGAGVGDAMGDGGGQSELYQLSQVVSGGDDAESEYNLQIGLADAPLVFSYDVADGDVAAEAHTEAYSGVYGWQWSMIAGQVPLASCPGGRLQATTTNLVVKALPEDEDGIMTGADEVMAGTISLADGSGNTAVVSYDGDTDTVSVQLNGGLAKTFSYDEINTMFVARCFGAM